MGENGRVTPYVERELTSPVDLCLDSGHVNPAAIGWSRTPLHRANTNYWGRKKQWEYWGIVTPTHIIGVVLSNLDYAGIYSLYVLDRATGREWNREATVPLVRDAVLPRHALEGTAKSAGGSVHVVIEQDESGAVLRATAEGMDLEVDLPATGRDLMAVVVPWTARRFQYTVKDLGRPVSGRLVLEGATIAIDAETSFAVLDHGRGKWPYKSTWNWGAGSEPGGARAIQLGGQWTDRTGSTENALFVAGVAHKISEDLTWSYDRTDWTRPWTVSGDRVQATLTPEHVREARTQLFVLGSDTHQAFGTWSGWATTDSGDRISLDGLVGWAEEAIQRW